MRYAAVFDGNLLGASAVYELAGSPCVYFRALARPDPAELRRLHAVAWNQGLAPILWIVTPTSVTLLNCFARPVAGSDEEALQELTLSVFDTTERGLAELNEFAGRDRFETGRFWNDARAERIDRRARVDESLLADLQDAEARLVRAGLPRRLSHSLLGRSIFVSYLADREILKPQFFRARFGEGNFADVLRQKGRTYDLFEWVRSTFNGDLFPLVREDERGRRLNERQHVTQEHLAIVRDFLTGTHDGQLSFWPYRFDVIPIELISSMYERFAYSSDSEQAKSLSTHYTPVGLVGLVLEQVFHRLNGRARVLDLTCGSGVFLVESLRRLVALRCSEGERLDRRLIRETLYGQVFGVDLSEEAVQIAAFSLYLAALELDPDPQPPSELTFKPLVGANLFVGDAFDPAATYNRSLQEKEFAAIVGNPPWTRDRMYSLSAKELRKQDASQVPWEGPDQALLWRARHFCTDSTVIALVMHARPFFSQREEAQAAKRTVFTEFRPLAFFNLSQLRQVRLFPHATAPAVVFVAERRPSSPDDAFAFVSVEWSAAFKRHGIIELGPEQVRWLNTHRVARDPVALKVASWGTLRDLDLVARLKKHPPLGDLIPENRRGQGFQTLRPSTATRKPRFLPDALAGSPVLKAGELRPFLIDTSGLERLTAKQAFHEARTPNRYRGPLVITTRTGLGTAGLAAAFSRGDVVYQEAFTGFSTPDERTAHYINAIINSKLATYFLFLTGSSWGIERDEVKPMDVFNLPIPSLDGVRSDLVERLLQAEFAIVEAVQRTGVGPSDEALSELNDAVYGLYDLDRFDRMIVEDMVSITIDALMKRSNSRAMAEAQPSDMDEYAKTALAALEPLLLLDDRSGFGADVLQTGRSALRVIRFHGIREGRSRVRHVEAADLGSVLDAIARAVKSSIAPEVAARRELRVYANNVFFVVKPAERRFWSRSAALRDVDEIVAEHMRAAQ